MIPNETIASKIVSEMTNEKVLSVVRFTTGGQYFVYDVQTTKNSYAIRLADMKHKSKFIAAMYWQTKLLPLGVPLAKFIHSDLQNNYSQFAALLMPRLPGNDLCNIYQQLTSQQKKNLADQMIKIQSNASKLPLGNGFGLCDSYEQKMPHQSWHDFIKQGVVFCQREIARQKIFDLKYANRVLFFLEKLKGSLNLSPPVPFLWDASERNVIVHQGKISGIVDVDTLCFGDPIYVIALTYTALKNEGFDTLYPDYWAAALDLNKEERCRLEFYRLFYALWFMHEHNIVTTNNQKIIYDIPRLKNLFEDAYNRLVEVA